MTCRSDASARPLPRILASIRATKDAEVAELLARMTDAALRRAAAEAPPPRDFFAAVTRARSATSRVALNLIAEVKKASPSKGLIRPDFDPPALARAYGEGGADAISCLTDREYFQGSLDVFAEVRGTTALPVLRKDFLIHPAQVLEARAAGADAVLLIARMLDADTYRRLHDLASELGMTALCEIHDRPDLDKTLALGCVRLIGINSRDLDTFTVDTAAAARLRESVPPEVPTVAESGIETPTDMRALAAAGFCAALVGESLMRQPDVARATRVLLGTENAPDRRT